MHWHSKRIRGSRGSRGGVARYRGGYYPRRGMGNRPTTQVNAVGEEGEMAMVPYVPFEGDAEEDYEVNLASAAAKKCHRCKGTGHFQSECRAKVNQFVDCYHCGKTGHFAVRCPENPNSSAGNVKPSPFPGGNPQNKSS